MSFYFLEIFRIRKMNFQVGADNEITMTSTEMDGGEKKPPYAPPRGITRMADS